MAHETAVDETSGRKFYLDQPDEPSGPLTFILNLHGGGSVGRWQREYFPIHDLVDEIVTEETVAAVSGQSYESLFASDQGIMFGNGQVWMSGVCEDDACERWDVKIITIQSTAQ